MTTLTLKHPIKQGSEYISELEFRRPTAKDMRSLNAERKDFGQILDLAGSICGQPPSVIDKLDYEDTLAVIEVVGSFLQPSQPTGETLLA